MRGFLISILQGDIADRIGGFCYKIERTSRFHTYKEIMQTGLRGLTTKLRGLLDSFTKVILQTGLGDFATKLRGLLNFISKADTEDMIG